MGDAGRLRRLSGALIVGLTLTGCSTYAASRYSISADTLTALQTFRGQTVAVGPFTARTPGKTEITCRGVSPIKTPDGEPFEEFIRKALIAELTIAEIYAASAPVVLTGMIESIDFSSGFTNADAAAWDIALTLRSQNGKSVAVTEHYVFISGWYGGTACNQTAQAFVPAVQNLVGTAVRHPEFPGLLK
jgi:hypothetical protein